MQFVTQWQNYWEEGEGHPRNGNDIQLGSSCKELYLWNEEEYHILQLISVTLLLKDGHIPKLDVHNTLLRQIMVGQGVHVWTFFWLLKVEVLMVWRTGSLKQKGINWLFSFLGDWKKVNQWGKVGILCEFSWPGFSTSLGFNQGIFVLIVSDVYNHFSLGQC